MLVLIAIVLALIPAIAILYPLVRGTERIGDMPDEGHTHLDVVRRWEAALASLKNTELDWATGNLTSDDYSWLRERYMKEAALVMKLIESQESQDRPPRSTMERAMRQALAPQDEGPGDYSKRLPPSVK